MPLSSLLLSPSSYSCTSFFLLFSSPKGMSKNTLEWRREVGLAPPNSISDKPELGEACLPSESRCWPVLPFFPPSFLSSCRSLQSAQRDECESKTNKCTKGKETFYPRWLPYHVRKHGVSKWVFPHLCMIYVNVRGKTTTHRDEQTCARQHTCTRMTRSFCSVCLSGLSGNDSSTNTLRERSAAGRGGMNYTSGLSLCIKQEKKESDEGGRRRNDSNITKRSNMTRRNVYRPPPFLPEFWT